MNLSDLLIKGSARKPALVVQGGGMRGVYSMAALAALDEAGLRGAFDVIVGSSAGAINAAYFLAGQANEAVDLYVDRLSNRNFVNPARIWRVVDIDYLVDVALKQYLPLDIDALRASSTLLEIILTDAATARPKIITNRDEVDFYEVIRATAALPGLYNKQIPIGEGHYVDGGTVDSIPLPQALSYGSEVVLAVVTRLPGYRRHGHGPFYRAAGKMLMRGQSRAIKSLIGKPDAAFNASMEALEQQHANSSRIFSVFPSDAAKLAARTTFDRTLLLQCAAMGRGDMKEALSATV